MASEDICANSDLVFTTANKTLMRSEANVQFTIAYFSLFLFIELVSVLAFVRWKDRFKRTQLRPTILVVMALLASLSQLLFGPVQTMSRGNYPCWLTVVLPVMVTPFAGISVIGKMILLLYLSRFSAASVKAVASKGRSSEMVIDSLPSLRLCTSYRKGVTLLFMSQETNQTPEEIKQDLVDLRFLLSHRGTACTTLLFVLPFLIVAFAMLGTDPVLVYCMDCANSVPMIICASVVSVSVILFGIFVWCRLRRLKDVWGLLTECMFCIFYGIIVLIGYFMLDFVEIMGVFYSTYSSDSLMALGMCLLVVQQSAVQLYLGYREEKRRKVTFTFSSVARSNSSRTLNYDQITDNSEVAKEFEKHLAEEFGLESLFFLRDVELWKTAFFDISESSRRARAKLIEKTFIHPNGLYAINVPHEVMLNITAKLQDHREPLRLDLFDEAADEIKAMLNTGAIMRFSEQRTRVSLVGDHPEARERETNPASVTIVFKRGSSQAIIDPASSVTDIL